MIVPFALIKESVATFIADDLLSRGASIAFYAVISLAPVLFIIVAIAGAVYGEDAARGLIVVQFTELMGRATAQIIQDAIAHVFAEGSGTEATLFGIATLIVTASGVFGEIQTALNSIWRASPAGTAVSRMVRARLVSLGLVGALGFLLLASLAFSTAVSALAPYLGTASAIALGVLNFVGSFVVVSLVFAAVYKILPDRDIEWRDVGLGAVVAALLFEVGKSAIGFYIGRSATASAYGAAGAVFVMLLWAYYTAQIFLFGAVLTRVFAGWRDERQLRNAGGDPG
ncbi:MAG TPA: YihY/virulence factor BrkB family protein [Stellaceae bacterium]|nr:YihY/virulence factor BrkB family protein [Stellaceae bacterium]